MTLEQRRNIVQAKMNGAVAALTYGYMAHMNNAYLNSVTIDTDINAVKSINIKNSACSSEMLRGLVHAFQDSYKGALSVNSTVCDPKYISWNCVMKDANGIMQRGAAADLFIDYPYATNGACKFDDGWVENKISNTNRNWYSVCYGNGKFIAVASNTNTFAYSTDGITWTEGTISSTGRNWCSVCYGNGKFVAVATNYFAYSTDGITWMESTISSTSRSWRSVYYGNGKFVAVGYASNYFAYSTDGITWTESTISSTSKNWNSVCYGNGKFVAVASNTNTFAYSTDGIHWTESTISSTNRHWRSVCYGNGKFVAVGYNLDERNNAISGNDFAYSADGINWTEGMISNTGREWNSICYDNGLFIIIGSNSYDQEYISGNDFAYSSDGIHWTEGMISNTGRNWRSVCYGNDKFVAVADSSNIFAYIYNIYNFDIIPSDVTKEDSTVGISNYIHITRSSSNIDEGFITFNHKDSSICGIIPFGNIVAPQILKNAIQTEQVKFITKKYDTKYLNDQFYRYFTFTNNGVSYIGITNDLMHFTVYTITGAYAFRDGVILMHIPEKDAIAMITRHPIVTDIITIDGNDSENMTDYSKPYYKLIELPFLKKYYKFSGQHVKNINLAINTIIPTGDEPPVIDSLTDNTLIINVFNRVYRIGVPNWNGNSLTAQNNKPLNYNYTATGTTSDVENSMQKSQIFTACDATNNILTIDCGIPSINTHHSINYDFDNPEYDKPATNGTEVTKNLISYQYNDITNSSDPESVIYPISVCNPNA